MEAADGLQAAKTIGIKVVGTMSRKTIGVKAHTHGAREKEAGHLHAKPKASAGFFLAIDEEANPAESRALVATTLDCPRDRK